MLRQVPEVDKIKEKDFVTNMVFINRTNAEVEGLLSMFGNLSMEYSELPELRPWLCSTGTWDLGYYALTICRSLLLGSQCH